MAGTFAALRHRDFRLFWFGQMVSLMGTWMQNVGQAWLVLQLTNSAFLLGLVSALQFAPMLVLSLYAGTVVDRVRKRNLLLVTQSSLMLLALLLAILTATHAIRYWHILVLATGLGVVNAFDMPVRQAYVYELVGGEEDLMNAIALNSTVFNAARIVGPGVAGLVMAAWGASAAFFANAASFLAVITGLSFIEPKPPAFTKDVDRRAIEHIREGLAYIKLTPEVLRPLLLMGLLSTFAMNFNILVPVFAKSVLHQTERGYGFLMSALGAGALLGSLSLAFQASHGPSRRMILAGGLGLSAFQMLLAPVHLYGLAMVILLVTGAAMMTFTASVNSTIQLAVPNKLRGRVMSVYSLVLGGVTPFGAMFAGTLTGRFGPQVTLVAGGGLGLIFTGASLALGLRRREGQIQ